MHTHSLSHTDIYIYKFDRQRWGNLRAAHPCVCFWPNCQKKPLTGPVLTAEHLAAWLTFTRPSLIHHRTSYAGWFWRPHYFCSGVFSLFHVCHMYSVWVCSHLWREQDTSGLSSSGVLCHPHFLCSDGEIEVQRKLLLWASTRKQITKKHRGPQKQTDMHKIDVNTQQAYKQRPFQIISRDLERFLSIFLLC